MSGEPQFDSGGVLARATPVLTFSTAMRGEALPEARRRADTLTPPPVSWSEGTRSKRNELPVIPRIVRRTRIDQHPILGPLARGAGAVRRVGVGTLLFAALGMGTLGTIAGLGARTFSDDAAASAGTGGDPRAFDAVASERLLARAPLSSRAENPPPLLPLAPASPVAPASQATPPVLASHVATHLVHPGATPAHGRVLPAHTAFAAAHAAKKHSPSTTLARR